MSVSFLAAGVATAVAAVITAILVGRFARLPRLDLVTEAVPAAASSRFHATGGMGLPIAVSHLGSITGQRQAP